MSAKPAVPEALTDDLFFGGRVRLLQRRGGHRAGTDASLLAAAGWSRLNDGAAVADLGAATGAVGLALATLGAGRAWLVEIDAELSELAAGNIRRNGLAGRAEAVACDVASLGRRGGPDGPAAETCDLVVMNPPFDAADRHRRSPDEGKALAHAAPEGLAETWIAAAARLLKPGGSLVMIHRPEALGELLAALDRRFGDVRLRAVHPRADAPASRLLIAAAKGRRGALSLLAPLVLHDAAGGFTAEADAAQRGAGPFAMDVAQKRSAP